MTNETHTKVSDKLVRDHLCHVTENETAWVFLQEPGFIGFGVVKKEKICWPPYLDLERQPDWERVSDLRLFGEKGEWHVWQDWERKHQCRLLEFNEHDEWSIWLGWQGKNQRCPQKSGKQIDILPEHHFLWGTKKIESDKPPWVKLTENRGTEIWLPLQGQVKDCEKNSDLPLRLEIKQVIDYDSEYHLAGIVDAALVALVTAKCDKPLLPTDALERS